MVFPTNKNGRRHLAKQLHEREYSFSNTNTALKAPVDNNLAVIATAYCEQQVLKQELLKFNKYRFPWLSILTLPLVITGNM